MVRLSVEQKKKIKEFILLNVQEHSNDIVSFTASNTSVSKASIQRIINSELKEEIRRTGPETKPGYELLSHSDRIIINNIKEQNESDIYLKYIHPVVKEYKQNVQDSIAYCFTEMVNNVIDHSGSDKLEILYIANAVEFLCFIKDFGVGIFEKLQKELSLENPRQSLIELSKGRYTSDSSKHSGEGIFFSSKICKRFFISSKGVLYAADAKTKDAYMLEHVDSEDGTLVICVFDKLTDRTDKEVFDEYVGRFDEEGFMKTKIPVKLMEYEGMKLVSRSQAKRLISRFDMFTEVVLDFSDVEEIGQAFADEIFRVFTNEHPDINLEVEGASEYVMRVINHVKISASNS